MPLLVVLWEVHVYACLDMPREAVFWPCFAIVHGLVGTDPLYCDLCSGALIVISDGFYMLKSLEGVSCFVTAAPSIH